MTLLCVSHSRDDPAAATARGKRWVDEISTARDSRARPGRLATIAHPRGDAWPAERLGELADAGVSVLVSALTTDEQEQLGHGDTAEAAAEVGMDFIAFPATDGGITREEATQVILLAGRLAANVRAGRFVVIQCFGGIGRSTLLACTTLVLLGIAPGDALRG